MDTGLDLFLFNFFWGEGMGFLILGQLEQADIDLFFNIDSKDFLILLVRWQADCYKVTLKT